MRLGASSRKRRAERRKRRSLRKEIRNWMEVLLICCCSTLLSPSLNLLYTPTPHPSQPFCEHPSFSFSLNTARHPNVLAQNVSFPGNDRRICGVLRSPESARATSGAAPSHFALWSSSNDVMRELGLCDLECDVFVLGMDASQGGVFPGFRNCDARTRDGLHCAIFGV